MGYNLVKSTIKGSLGAILVLFSVVSPNVFAELTKQQWNAIIAAKYENCRDALDNERARVKARIDTNDYTQNRGENGYTFSLRADEIPPLSQFLDSLAAGSIIADGGAGYAVALREILSKRIALQGLALGVQIPTNSRSSLEALFDFMNESQRLEYLQGKKIEEMMADPASAIHAYSGRVSLILDIMGALSYTEDIGAVLNAYADLLKEGGDILIQFGESDAELWVPFGSYKKRLKFRELNEWIPQLTGGRLVKVAAGPVKMDKGMYDMSLSVLHLRKVSSLQKPPSAKTALKLIRDGRPAWRKFEIIKP